MNNTGYSDGSAGNGVKGYTGPKPNKPQPFRKPPTLRVGRNKPCPCKSGKKFKHCCLSKIQAFENVSPEYRQQALASVILGKPL